MSFGAKSRTSSRQRASAIIQHCEVAKINADKVQLFAATVERHLGIESKHFDSNLFNEVNQFIEDNHRYFDPPEDP